MPQVRQMHLGIKVDVPPETGQGRAIPCDRRRSLARSDVGYQSAARSVRRAALGRTAPARPTGPIAMIGRARRARLCAQDRRCVLRLRCVGLLVLLAHERAGEQEVGRGTIAGNRTVMYHGDAEQRLHVDIVRLRLEWVPEEEHDVQATLRDPRADLLVSAKWSAEEALDRKTEFALNEPPGRARGVELMLCK